MPAEAKDGNSISPDSSVLFPKVPDMDTPTKTLQKMVYLLGIISVAQFAIIVFLSVDPDIVVVSQSPFIKQADGTYQIRPGDIICEGTCPSVDKRIPGVNLYKNSGGINIGNLTVKLSSDGNIQFINNNQIMARFTKGAFLIGDTDIPLTVPGSIYLAGKKPQYQLDGDFATILSTTSVIGIDGQVLNVDRIKENSRTFGRVGWRWRTTQTSYSSFDTPTPQLIMGYPSIQHIYDNIQSSIITEDSETTLAAYPCVDGPFRTVYSRLHVTVHQTPSTCANRMNGRFTEIVLTLKPGFTCLPAGNIQSIITNLQSVAQYPDLCFESSACNTMATSIAGRQRMANGQNVTTSIQTIPLGCSSSVIGVLYDVRCTRDQS